MTRWTNEDIQRGIDAHVAANQLFTPELKDKIHEQALQREKTLHRKPATKRISLVFSVAFGFVMTVALLFFIVNQQVQAPAVTTTTLHQEAGLSAKLIDKATKGYAALGSNDFDGMKQYFHSEVKIDEVNETVQFVGDLEPLQTKYFPAAEHTTLEIQPIAEEMKNGLYMFILRHDHDSFEIHFKRDALHGDEYRIVAILNAN